MPKSKAVLALVGAMLLAVVGHAQSSECNSDVNYSSIQCSNSICTDEYPFTYGVPCNEGACFFYPWTNTYCCGVSHIYLDASTGGCLLSELKDEGARKALTLLAQKEEILLPSCSGAYLPAESILRLNPGTNRSIAPRKDLLLPARLMENVRR